MVERRRSSRFPVFILGWREWVELPELGVGRVKAKLDTGARTSALHATDIDPFERGGARWVRFVVHPEQRSERHAVRAEAVVIDVREVRSSNGVVTLRQTIRTTVTVAGRSWPLDLTLVGRDEMGFRMLLGRRALRERALVDSGRSFTAGVLPRPG